jgi:hypothetical protein
VDSSQVSHYKKNSFMSNIQERINTLRPNVVSFRFGKDGMAIIDAVFKKGWKIPAVQGIEASIADEKSNYYMIYAKAEGVGIDELFDFVQYVRELNRERELKHILYQKKLVELKDLFKTNDLATLETLQYITNIPKIEEEKSSYDEETDEEQLDLDADTSTPTAKPEPIATPQPITPEPVVEQAPQRVVQTIPAEEPRDATMADNSVIVSEEKIKEISELNSKRPSTNERRGPVNNVTHSTAKVNGAGVELPPKKKPRVEVQEFKVPATGQCNCGPDDACPACIDGK